MDKNITNRDISMENLINAANIALDKPASIAAMEEYGPLDFLIIFTKGGFCVSAGNTPKIETVMALFATATSILENEEEAI